ncbi:uncharacterized protein LOC143605310 [Bidens hawaiensis]|uniref:uncharacterized protein LOC143605310 n=1 Tax=Bidens hawaiensis TaxID=980011 RepID=UPI00404A589C
MATYERVRILLQQAAPFEALYGQKYRLSLCWAEISPVAYRLDLPEKLYGVHNVFHVTNLKKCLAHETLVVPLEKIEINKQLDAIEERVEIFDREAKTHRHRKIPIVRIRWNSKRGPEFTWEREDQMRKKYPQLFKPSVKP